MTLFGIHAGDRFVIPPAEDDRARPLWSVMIPTYNQGQYLREALTSVLAQDPGPDQMQIEVADDASTTDDPEAIVRELGQGRVSFFRQPENVGHTRNFETCLRRSRGELIHLLHGDDHVDAGFYKVMEQPFLEHPEIGAAFCRVRIIDPAGDQINEGRSEQPEPGILHDWLTRIARGQRLQTPTIVVRRAVYELLGGFDRRLTYSEDWEMWARIAAHFPVWYEPRALAAYRVHPASSTRRHARSGADIRDLRRAIEIISTYLPADRAEHSARSALEICALTVIRRSHRSLKHRNFSITAVQMLEALRCSRSTDVVFRSLILAAHVLWAALRLPRPSRLRRLVGRWANAPHTTTPR